MSEADDILYAPIVDHAALLKKTIDYIRNRPYEAGYRAFVAMRGRIYRLAYTMGAYMFGCPYGPSGASHHEDCLCEAIRDSDMLINLDAGRDLFDGSESPELVRSWFAFGEGSSACGALHGGGADLH